MAEIADETPLSLITRSTPRDAPGAPLIFTAAPSYRVSAPDAGVAPAIASAVDDALGRLSMSLSYGGAPFWSGVGESASDTAQNRG